MLPWLAEISIGLSSSVSALSGAALRLRFLNRYTDISALLWAIPKRHDQGHDLVSWWPKRESFTVVELKTDVTFLLYCCLSIFIVLPL